MITNRESREALKKMSKKDRNEKYYQNNKEDYKVECEICSCAVNKYYLKVHEKTKRHLKWAELKLNAQ